MKYLAWISAMILFLLLVVYVVLFTPAGNDLLKPIVEAKIKEELKVKSKLETFSLSMSDFKVVLSLDKTNKVTVKGSYSIFARSFDINYEIDFKNLKSLERILEMPLNGAFNTDGVVRGDLAFMSIDGKTNIGEGETSYHVELQELNPTSIIANMKNASLASLLYLGAKNPYATAEIDLDINLKNITPHKLDGDIKLVTRDGVINPEFMKSDFNVTIPKTSFNMSLDAKLKGDDVVYNYDLLSNLFKINSSGTLTPEPLKADLKYAVDIKNLEVLKPITGADIRGALKLNGTLSGDKDKLIVHAFSDIASSETIVEVVLKDFEPTLIRANMKNASLASLLYLGGKNPYATANIDLNINLKDITPHKLDGDVKLVTRDGSINPKFMKSDFDVTIPKTSFSMSLDAKLKGDDVVYNYDLVSNLFKINSSGTVVPDPLKANLKYALDVKDLEVLKPISGADIRGALKLNGTLSGDKEKLLLHANSDVASSQTTIEAVLKDFEPASLKAKIQNLDVAKLLYMLKQPHYADALLSVDADISDARVDSLKGEVKSTITKGLFNSAYLTKEYEFSSPMPKSTFNAQSTTFLKDGVADTNVKFNSNLANLDIKSAKFNIKDSSLKSDYEVDISDLDTLYFVTEQHMRGSLKANGELSMAKDLDFTLLSNIADGKLEAKLHNDDFSANLSDMKSAKLLYMLTYPELVDATLNAKVNYNLAQSKGVLDGDIANAVFAKNKTFDLIKEFTKVDMYRENFNGKVGAKIDKEHILASLDLRSKETALVTKDAKINTKTNQMDSDLSLVIKNDTIHANVKGDINSPKVNVDLEKFLKSEAGKKVIEKVDKLFKKLF